MSNPEGSSKTVHQLETGTSTPQTPENLDQAARVKALQASANDFEAQLSQNTSPNQENTPENASEEIFQKYGLTIPLVESLRNQGITVEIFGSGNDRYPYLDTSNVHHGVLDKDGNILSGKMSSLPIAGAQINSIQRSSDGITVFHITDTRTGENRSDIFSKTRFEELPNAHQLPFGQKERANAIRRDDVARQIEHPTHGRDSYGLNPYLVGRMLDQGINVNYVAKNNQNHPYLDTSNVHHGVLDKDGNILSGKMSSLPIDGQYINSIGRSSDGITIFDVVDVQSGKLKKYIFSKAPWESVAPSTKQFYERQLNNM